MEVEVVAPCAIGEVVGGTSLLVGGSVPVPRFNFWAHNADPMKSPAAEPLMMSSQLGRVILGGSASTEDEMNAAPDQSGCYGPIDGLLEELAAQAGGVSRIQGDRRPGIGSSTD
jgi:hypothetical protein